MKPAVLLSPEHKPTISLLNAARIDVGVNTERELFWGLVFRTLVQ